MTTDKPAIWIPTEEQIKQVVKDWSPKYGGDEAKWEFKFVPLKDVDYLNFNARDYKHAHRDPKGGPEYVKTLRAAFRDDGKLPPAVGYWDAGIEKYVAHDGNHRISGAKLEKIRMVPMIVFKTEAQRLSPPKGEQLSLKLTEVLFVIGESF